MAIAFTAQFSGNRCGNCIEKKIAGKRFARDYRQNFRGDIIITRVPELLLIYEISRRGGFKTRQLAIKKENRLCAACES